ncbi:AraC family transcriptional regulator [Luteimonas abyssi]|uniref:AraC family transcriptional regulator n=1 Tax=Luteimonas abyssi TaxID=1247514 RepID=UPI000737D604|nr:AraC family transcriptional regulator [Luteimonas abyssi]
MDPLSDVLSLLKPRSHVSSGFDAGGDWSIQFPDQNRTIKCYAVVSGAAWLAVDGVDAAAHLRQGDCFVLPTGRAFRLASDPALSPEPSSRYFPPPRPGSVIRVNGGGDFFIVGSRFEVQGRHAGILMGLLPPIVHIHRQADQAALRWSVERMMQELREPLPGHALVAQHLAHLMLVQALRLHVHDTPAHAVGWLFALADRQLGAAIGAVHADPAHRWTLQALAERACMSRSSFALKFRDALGAPPMEYVTRWRMVLAADRLEHTDDPISKIAPALGYESESAFGTAFKRVMGQSPREYARMLDPAADTSQRALAAG